MLRAALFVLILTPVLSGVTAAQPPTHLVLGNDETADYILLRPRQVEEGPDGNLYVLDTGDATIKVFTPDGDFLRAMGGQGEGPGMFQRSDGATLGFTPGGLLFFTEFFGGHRWLTLIELDGTLVRTISPRLDTFFGMERAVALADGRFLLQLALDSTVERRGDVFYYTTPRVLTVLDPQGVLGPEIVRTERVRLISTSPSGGTSNLPFTPVFCWEVMDGQEVIWSEGLGTDFRVFDLAGREQESLPTPLPVPEPVGQDELVRWQEDRQKLMQEQHPAWWERFGIAVRAYDQALTPKPNLSRVSGTPAGNFLIQAGTGPEDERARHWLLDREGRVLAQADLPLYGLHFSAHFLLFFTSDGDGLALVNALRREPDEAGSLVELGRFFRD